MPITIPNLLTVGRIVLIPLFVGVFYLPLHWLDNGQQNLFATAIFIAAAVTDWFDGWLARRLGQTSAFGAFLDPVADKLMVAAALMVLVQMERADAIVAFVIVGREVTISALREWMAKIGSSKSVAVHFIGKVKTTAQMVAIPLLLYHSPIGPVDSQRLGTWLLCIAAVLTIWSMVFYLKVAWPELTRKERTL